MPKIQVSSASSRWKRYCGGVSSNFRAFATFGLFEPWENKNTTGQALIKAGKCTTDHISMTSLNTSEGLDNISNNMLIGAINAYNQKPIQLKITGQRVTLSSAVASVQSSWNSIYCCG
jgi:hypothetical protein